MTDICVREAVFEFVDNYLSDGVNEIEKQMREVKCMYWFGL